MMLFLVLAIVISGSCAVAFIIGYILSERDR